jgi:hypothetical protein
MKKLNFFLVKDSFKLSEREFNAILSRNGWRPLIKHLLRVTNLMAGGLTNNWVRLTIVVIRRFEKIYRAQGHAGLVKYLKVCSVCLQQYLGGHVEHDLTPLGLRVKRTKGGIPKILPTEVRRRIQKGDTTVIKWSLTLFALFRVIIYPGKLKTSTITSARTVSLQGEKHLYPFISTFLGLFIREKNMGVHLLSAPEPFSINRSSPTSDSLDGMMEVSTHPDSITRSVIVFLKNPELFSVLKEFRDLLKPSFEFNQILDNQVETIRFKVQEWLAINTASFAKDGSYRLDKSSPLYEKFMSEKNLKRRNYLIDKVFLEAMKVSAPKLIRNLGKLGLKDEAAGKIRVFAMVDPFTQWLLRPLHKFLFKKLKNIPMDGTFDQLKPLTRVPFGLKPLYSFDLSAATDRLPVSLQEKILSHAFGDRFAFLWKTLLVGRPYSLRDRDGKYHSLTYAVGQPMGALSSWAMLALTHHFIVQCAAWQTGITPKTALFDEYAVLGDDIVI